MYVFMMMHAYVRVYDDACICACLWSCMHMYVFMMMHAYLRVYDDAWICACLWWCMHMCVFMMMHAYVRVYDDAWICACLWWCMHMCVFMHAGLCTCGLMASRHAFCVICVLVLTRHIILTHGRWYHVFMIYVPEAIFDRQTDRQTLTHIKARKRTDVHARHIYIYIYVYIYICIQSL